MLSIIAATNRAGNNTLRVAKEVHLLLTKMINREIKLLDLLTVDFDELNTPSYQSNSLHTDNIGKSI